MKAARAAAKHIGYQYAIVDLSSNDFRDLIAANSFNYSNTKVKWVTVKTREDGTINVNLPWNSVNGKQVLVRKAAVGTNFSSQVEIFNAPTKAEGLTRQGAFEVGCWSKLTLAKYGTMGFTDTNNNIEYCPYAEVKYNGDKKFYVRVYAAGNVNNIDQSKMTVKIGNTTYTADNTVTPIVASKSTINGNDVDYDLLLANFA